MKRQEEKEKVLVPLRRRENIPERKELPEDIPAPSETKVPEMPRRWYVF